VNRARPVLFGRVLPLLSLLASVACDVPPEDEAVESESSELARGVRVDVLKADKCVLDSSSSCTSYRYIPWNPGREGRPGCSVGVSYDGPKLFEQRYPGTHPMRRCDSSNTGEKVGTVCDGRLLGFAADTIADAQRLCGPNVARLVREDYPRSGCRDDRTRSAVFVYRTDQPLGPNVHHLGFGCR
jgi:hypothetical protein